MLHAYIYFKFMRSFSTILMRFLLAEWLTWLFSTGQSCPVWKIRYTFILLYISDKHHLFFKFILLRCTINMYGWCIHKKESWINGIETFEKFKNKTHLMLIAHGGIINSIRPPKVSWEPHLDTLSKTIYKHQRAFSSTPTKPLYPL